MFNPDSSSDYHQVRQQAKTIIKEVGDFVFDSWHSFKQITYKDERDMVTEIDLEAEKRLEEGLKKIFPHAGFILEEGDDKKKDEYNWVIDPIDQTKNYVGKIPLFFIQTSLLKDNEPIVSLVYNPVSRQLFSSSRSEGTFLNDELIQPKTSDSLKAAIVDIDFGGNYGSVNWKLTLINKLIEKAYKVRLSGGAFSTGILTGGIDAYLVLNEKTKIMDQMPRIGLMLDSGFKGKWGVIEDKQIFLAGNDVLFEEISSLLSLNL